MSFIPIMEISNNGTEAIEKEEDERITDEQEVGQSEKEEEIEGTRSMIAKEGHPSRMAFFNCYDKVCPSKPRIIIDCRYQALQRAGIS